MSGSAAPSQGGARDTRGRPSSTVGECPLRVSVSCGLHLLCAGDFAAQNVAELLKRGPGP